MGGFFILTIDMLIWVLGPKWYASIGVEIYAAKELYS